ncbi:MAG: helix-turn-helix domain-containing protein [Candidatus Parcubacteria bacterium]|nr:helix-turn-helix domain-containing protein [Candidatus Parcubacteria bacterium]
MEEKELIPIGDAAEMLGVSITTLRRWDESGRFPAIKSVGGHRMYSKMKVELYLHDLFAVAKDWCVNQMEIPTKFYCPNRAVFEARLAKMMDELSKIEEFKNIFNFIVAIAGEIGNNSFDHNLGNWPDEPGVFFGYDTNGRKVVLADRGIGILESLKRIRPSLNTHESAISTAFTEVITGRAPEDRGNGLKFVKNTVIENSFGIVFQTGDTELIIGKQEKGFHLKHSSENFHGCLLLLTF